MSSTRLRAGLMSPLVGLCVLLSTLAQGATLQEVKWQAGSDRDTESLVLRFAAEIPEVEIAVEPWGLSVWLPGVSVEGVTARGIRIESEEQGTRLRIERRGVEFRSLRLEGSAVLLSIHGPYHAPAVGTTYRVGVGDLVTVLVYANEDLSGDFPVAPDGTIQVPLVGPVPAAGLTESQLSRQLRDLLERDFLVDPQVSVSVKTYQSQWAYVAGAVSHAVRIPLGRAMSVKDVLSEAGVALAPGQQIVLTRTGGDGETLVLDSDQVDSGDSPVPRDGDVLNVQEPQYVFIQGEVRRPGRFPLSADMTILHAIAVAEGFTDWANKKEIRVLRTMGGETIEEMVNFKRIEERKDPDLGLLPGDVILIKRKIL